MPESVKRGEGEKADLVPVWREERSIESYDVDALGRLHSHRLLAYLLNAAWSHARGTSYGQDSLAARNLMWVLLKVQIRVGRLPEWNERISIETWGKRAVRFYALRDFVVREAGRGEKIISATSSWAMLNRAGGRPQRLDGKANSLPWQPGRDELETNLEKVPGPVNGIETGRFPVLFSDIDMNRHVNSARYLQWMIDSHPCGYLEARGIRSLDLSFLSEALPGDEVAVLCQTDGDGESCVVKRSVDGKELCRGRLLWQNSGQGEGR